MRLWRLIVSCFTLCWATASGVEHYCGDLEYDEYNERCCANRIFRVPDELGPYDCCGSDLLAVDFTWECCGGVKMENGPDTVCCNNQIINTTLDECCNNVVHEKQAGHECCGTEYYNTESHTCCDNNGYSLPKVADGRGSCCGTDVYDPISQICCTEGWNQMVQDVGSLGVMLDEAKCCGNSWINKTTQICCEGETHDNTNGLLECSGGHAYDPTTQVVCGDFVHEIVEGKTHCCDGKLINLNKEPCCSRSPSSLGCCGRSNPRKFYDPSEESCVNNRVLKAVPEVNLGRLDSIWRECGGELYPTTLKMCCDGHLRMKYKDSQCCGNESFRTTTQLCMGEGSETASTRYVTDKISPNAEKCSHTLQYDPDTQTCCRETSDTSLWRVFDGVESDGQCCRISEDEIVFSDSSSQTCCKGNGLARLHDIPLGQGQCCGPDMLDTGTQLCDQQLQEVVDIPAKRPNDDALCVPRRRDSSNQDFRQTYQSSKEYCTHEGFIMPRAEGKGICGGEIYDLESHGCCYGAAIYRLVTQQCCGWNVRSLIDDEKRPLTCCDDGNAYHNGTDSCVLGRVWQSIPQSHARLFGSMVYDDHKFTYHKESGELVPFGAGPEIHLCGRAHGYPEDQQAYSDREQECCGGQLIGPGQTCCGDIISETPGTGLKEGQCCGREGYNPNTHICCIDTLTPVMEMDQPTCCMHKAYDNGTSDITCCGGILQRVFEDETCSEESGVVYRPSDEIVCDGVRHPSDQGVCCGKSLYDPEMQLCCDGILYEAGDNNACCGNQPYTYQSGNQNVLCCQGRLNYEAESKECCGHTSYNPTAQECLSTGGKDYVIARTNITTDSDIQPFCSAETHQSTTTTCCDGLLYNGIRECCGNKVIAIEEEKYKMCCNGEIVRKIYEENSHCCASGQIIDGRGMSCETPQADLQPGWLFCNESESYYPYSQGCCGEIVYELENGHCIDGEIFEYCGSELYSKSNQTCCNTTLSDIAHGECCEGAAFDPMDHVCCEGSVNRKGRRKNECCGSMLFDPKREVCCEVGPVRTSKHSSKQQLKKCCDSGYELNLDTRRCEEIPQLCRGLDRSSGWKEVVDDCSKPLAIEFIASDIKTKQMRTVIGIESMRVLHGQHDLQLNKIQLPTGLSCPQLTTGTNYVVLSAGDPQDSNKLVLQEDDFITTQSTRIARRVVGRSCESL